MEETDEKGATIDVIDDQNQWAQAEDESEVFVSALEGNELEQRFAMPSFMH